MKRLTLVACIALLFALVLLSQQGYIPKATGFDASADYFLRGGDLTGDSDGKLGIFSGWLRIDGGDGTARDVLANAGIGVLLRLAADNKFDVRLENPGGSVIGTGRSNSTYLASSAWLHFLSSWDQATDSFHFYVSDVEDSNGPTLIDDVVNYTENWALGARDTGGEKWDGAMAEIYFNSAQFLDFSVIANRRKFITADGKPVDLGPGCYKPTGTVAIMCMQTQFNNFGNNSGSGGDFVPQDPVTDTVGPIPIELLPGRAVATRGRGGRGGRGGRVR